MSGMVLAVGEGFESVGTVGAPKPIGVQNVMMLVQGPLGQTMDFVGDGGGRDLQLPGFGSVGAAGSPDFPDFGPIQTPFREVMKIEGLAGEGFEAGGTAEPLNKAMGMGGVVSGFPEPLICLSLKEIGALSVRTVGWDEVPVDGIHTTSKGF